MRLAAQAGAQIPRKIACHLKGMAFFPWAGTDSGGFRKD